MLHPSSWAAAVGTGREAALEPRRGGEPLVEPDETDPLSGEMRDVLEGLAARFGFHPFERWRVGPLLGVFAFANGAVSFAILGTLAVLIDQPFVFPSLGPTAVLLIYKPLDKVSSPRCIVLGHLVGVASGYVALVAFGRTQAAPVFAGSFTWGAAGAAALSLALTASLMTVLDVPHPPAAATTLIVSLGVLHHPIHLVVLMTAVVLLGAQGVMVNQAAGLDVAVWRSRYESLGYVRRRKT